MAAKRNTDQLYRIQKARRGTGRGLFAARPIKKGAFIIEYTGKHIPTSVADTLGTKYLFEIDETWTVDGSPRSNTARYINHSCNPNCEAVIEDGHINIYARRPISRGEELTMDYGEEYFDEFIKPKGCRCEVCATVL
ncbi:hypothetical protein COU20_02965 [Candidatus Kaiserbacteria bacterium CG10_big_fil_rev_8_21_14_0_10_59_10]|uniref:SET domain-containing protein n=1 Tax=Candidatus Kaiserbacteria bacterium CG10_big_fil_rev_8_21_14_0_10_59_10 TaxID=1974612 RepID=A0A2H0U7P5_9BACT|nr:MAG: hypothetical protein COU20_02965 [Candidatus Kaiserbacteria bacterium CG10_big_fil_rev_8_21_14_0_10_59_10]